MLIKIEYLEGKKKGKILNLSRIFCVAGFSAGLKFCWKIPGGPPNVKLCDGRFASSTEFLNVIFDILQAVEVFLVVLVFHVTCLLDVVPLICIATMPIEMAF